MVVNQDSTAYQVGRLVGRVVIIVVVSYLLSKRWGRKPIDKSLSEKKKK